MGKRYAAKIDANQPEIVKALRGVYGVTVTPTHAAGDGFPDLCVGFRGQTFLLEVKDGSKPPSARKLTADQEKWHTAWTGQVAVVKDVTEALAVLGITSKEKGPL